jgi:predicted RNA-binding protein with EMAP domain
MAVPILSTRIKHEIKDKNVLAILESLYQLYTRCHISRNYSDVVEKSIEEMKNENEISIQNLLFCFVRKANTFTFPVMHEWKKQSEFLLIHDEFLPADYDYNNWQKHIEFEEYIEYKLLSTPSRKIISPPETKTVMLTQEEKEFIMKLKKEFNYDTIDDAILHILKNSSGWKLISFISRLLNENITLKEIDENLGDLGDFIFVFAEQKNDEDEIKIVAQFYPLVHVIDFGKIMEVSKK